MFKQLFLLAEEPIVIFEKRNSCFYLKDANPRFLQQNKSGKTLDALYNGNEYTLLLSLLTKALTCNKQVQCACMEKTFTVTPLSSNIVAIAEKTNQKQTLLFSHFTCVSDLMLWIDTNEVIYEHSPSYEKLTGFSKEDLDKKSLFEFVHKDDIKKVRKALVKTRKDQTPRTLEWRMWNINGTYFSVETSFSPILDAQQNTTSILLIGRDITKRKAHEEKLYHFAFHDPLTGLPNRRLFSEQLKQTVYQYERKKAPFAIFLLDCDHFKYVNDTFGHDIGDEVIKGFAERIKGLIRKSDVLSRFGGDEYALLLPDVHAKEDIEQVAHRIIEKIQEPWVFGSATFQTTTSVGVFYVDEACAEVTIENVLKNADIALYQAKNNGKNHFQFYQTHRTATD